MRNIVRWFRKRREQRRLLKERKKREAERRIQREKQDREYARALRLTLRELQRTMDPLLASQAYSNRFCPLTRLPEELLLIILNFLSGDDVTLCCLRIASRTFLRILHRRSGFWTMQVESAGPPISFLRHGHADLQLQFRRLLQRDGRCEKCRRWNDAFVRFSHDPCKFKHVTCGVGHWCCDYGRPYCSACDSDHDACQFPCAYRQKPSARYRGTQRCLGQQGSVQLCAHVQIYWASIKAHIDDWRQQQQRGGGGGSDWQACLASFNIECQDPSHDTRCTALEAPTWPRARLGTPWDFLAWQPLNSNIVVLYLEWTPHGRIDALAPTADGRVPAPELRALFRRFRRLGPADVLYPLGRPDALPEMACFRPSFPIYYKTGEEGEGAEKTPPPPSPALSPSRRWNQWLLSQSCKSVSGFSPIGRNNRSIDVVPHCLRGAGGTGITSQCLAVSYQKGIMVCQTAALTDPTVKLIPSHHWLHAMDARTYPHRGGGGVFRPQCRDESCTNYYLKSTGYYS